MGPGHPFARDVDECDIEQATPIADFTPPTRQVRKQVGQETWVAAWSPDGHYFAWSLGLRKVKLVPWHRQLHRPIEDDDLDHDGQHLDSRVVTIDAGNIIRSLAFGTSSAHTHSHSLKLNWYRYKKFDDLILATGLQNGRIRTWEVKTGALLLELVDHHGIIMDVKFAPDGSLRLVSASKDSTLKVWQLEDDGNMSNTLKASKHPMNACCWAPDSKTLCGVGDARIVHLWDMDSYKSLGRLDGHHHSVVSCEFSPDGALLATASYDTTVIIWDPHYRQILIKLLHLHPVPSSIFAGGDNGSFVSSVAFSHDGLHVASVCEDQYVRFWNLFDPEIPEQVTRVRNPLCCSFSPDGSVLAVGAKNGAVSTWLAPMEVSSLQHMCRMAIRRLLPSNKIADLHLPHRLLSFLRFNEETVQ